MIKKTIVIVACCALIAPLATAQTRSTTTTRKTTTTSEPVTVTGTMITTTTEEGTAAGYQPANTLVIRADNSNVPGNYVLNGPGHIVNKNGEMVQPPIKPGTHVQVFYVNMGDRKVVDHVVVD